MIFQVARVHPNGKYHLDLAGGLRKTTIFKRNANGDMVLRAKARLPAGAREASRRAIRKARSSYANTLSAMALTSRARRGYRLQWPLG